MNESESTQIWDDEENFEVQDNAAFGDALASLEEQLQEHDNQELYDEEAQEVVMFEEGLSQETPASHFTENSSAEDTLAFESEFEAYPSFEEAEADEALNETSSSQDDHGNNGHQNVSNEGEQEGATDDFNLATLTQLVDEIRHESQRVSEMKASVAKALNLIQEMSESLKS